ncbi:MAG: hypothetical protein U0235_18440 [Polyangiaceae bacterium]
MKTRLLVATLLTMTIAATAAVGCGSSGSSDSESSAGAVVANNEESVSSDTVVTAVAGMMSGSQKDFLRRSIVPTNWTKSALVQDIGFEFDETLGIVPKGFEMKLAPGEWSRDTTTLSLDIKDVVKNKSFTVVGGSKDGSISIQAKITVEEQAQNQLKISLENKATVKGNPAGAKELAKASEALLQVFDAARIQEPVSP